MHIVPTPDSRDIFPGPRAFKTEEAPLFFGREREAGQVTDLLISYQDVLLYAQSGAGKSSLINARIVPSLGTNNCFVGRVGGELPPGLELESIPNIFAYNLIASTINDPQKASGIVGTTLEQFFKPSKTGENTYLIIDQAEELFRTYPERWTDRRPFFEQLRSLLKSCPCIHVLFAIREEYLASLEFYSDFLPNQLRIRYYLQSLREAQATKAIAGPLEETGISIPADVTKRLVDSLRTVPVQTARGETAVLGEFVEPLHLQVVCQNLVAQLKGAAAVTQEQVSTFAGVDQALSDFYERALSTAAAQSKVPEAKIRAWFDRQLITPAGTRGIVFRGETETAGLPNNAVSALADQNILRAERRGGAIWYELTHDRFIAPIRRSNTHWREEQGEAYRNSQKLEQQAAEWDKAGRPPEGLLNLVQLKEAQRWIASPEAADAGVSEVLRALVAASSDEQQRKQDRLRMLEEQARSARRFRNLLIVSVAACILCIVAMLAWLSGIRSRAKLNSVRLASVSVVETSSSAEHALLMAMYANSIMRTPEATDALEHALHELRLERTLAGHSGNATAVAFSPDGKFLATGGDDHTARIWDASTWSELHKIQVAEGNVRSVAFTPDGKSLVTTSLDYDGKGSFLEIWDVASGRQLAKASRPTWLLTAAVNPKLPIIATAEAEGETGVIHLFRFDGSQLEEFAHWENGKEVNGLAFSMGGEALATAGWDHLVKVWPVESCTKDPNCKPYLSLDGNHDQVMEVAFSPDGQYLASAGMDLTVHIWNSKGENLHTLANGHVNTVFAVAFDRQGRLVSVGADARVKVWDPLSGRELFNLAGHGGPVEAVAFSPDSAFIATASWDHTVKIWNVSGHKGTISEVAYSPDGKYLASGSHDHTVKIWDAATMQEVATLPAVDDKVSMVSFSPDGTMLAASTNTGDSYVAKVGENKWWLHLQGEQVVFNPVAPEAFAYKDNGSLLVYELKIGVTPRVLTNSKWYFSALAVSPDGKWLAAGHRQEAMELWESASTSGQPHCTFATKPDYISSIAFSPDGNTIATGSLGGAIKLWDAQRCAALPTTFSGHKNSVAEVAFSRDGRFLGSASWDQSAKLWDVATGKQVMSAEFGSIVNGLSFSPDGKRMAFATESPVPWLYPLGGTDSDMQRAHAVVKKLGTTLPSEECLRYFDSKACPSVP
jgi:WD40 repeat protein